MRHTRIVMLLVMATAWWTHTGVHAEPMGTAFTYQGQLKDAGVPADGLHDFEFTLWDAEVGGNVIARPVPLNDVDVVRGLFNVELDFGVGAFNDNAVWLEIAVGRSGDALTPLSPRQRLTPTPQALQTRGLFVDDNLNIGIGTADPLAQQHMEGMDLSVSAIAFMNEDLLIEDGDAVLGLYSDDGGDWGSALSLGEVDAFGNLVDKWTLARRTSNAPGGSALRLTYGADANYAANITVMHIAPSGNVGIGTDTPEGVLDVHGPNGGNIHLGVNDVGARIITTDVAGNLNLKPRLDGAGVFVRDGNTSKGIRLYGGGLNEIQSVDLDGNSPAWLGINPNGGNVGVGTNTPAARLDVAAGDIRLDANREVLFEDNGQIRSHDDNHRILFRRDENKLELREWGDIVLSAGATAGQETASVVVKSSGKVGIGTDDPHTFMHVRQGASPAGVSAGTFQAFNENGAGVVGHGIAAAATGVRGITESDEGVGVHGINNNSSGHAVGVLGETSGTGWFSAGVRGRTTEGSFGYFGVLGTQGADPSSIPANGAGVFGYSDKRVGVAGYTSGTESGENVIGVWGVAQGNAPAAAQATGVYGQAGAEGGRAVAGSANCGSDSCVNYGGWFESWNGGYGVHAETASTNVIVPEGPAGLLAEGGTAIRGISTVSGGNGVVGVANGLNSWGVYGESDSGYAGRFEGDVLVIGDFNVTGGSKSFLIDHPLDPANKYLAHSCVESDERLNTYTGNVTLDPAGEAWVQLPDWFEEINTDLRYQLTCIGGFAPAYIAQEIKENKFKIAGGAAGMKISWTVTGVRDDPYAHAEAFAVERDKPDHERGYYLQPELFGHGKEKGMIAAKAALSEWLQSDPEVIAEQKRRRAEAGKRFPVVTDRQDTVAEPATGDSHTAGIE